jgi:hypothetical protein
MTSSSVSIISYLHAKSNIHLIKKEKVRCAKGIILMVLD